MSDLDLDLLREWEPASPPSDEVRADALARLEAQFAPVTPRRSRTARRFGRRFAIAAVAATVLVAIAIFAIQRAVDERVERVKTVGVPKDALGGGEVGKDPVNILVIGSDARDGTNPEAFGTPAETGPPKSDTMFVLRVDGDTVRALWIPRDLLMSTNELFNSAFNTGPQAAIDAVERELGVTIDHYVELDFRSFVKVVDEVGGVAIYAPGPLRDSYSGLNLTGPGCRTLDGPMALAWVRSRHLEQLVGTEWTDASPRADLDRQQRQQEFLRAFGARVRAQTAGDPIKAVRIVDRLAQALIIDSKFEKAEIFGLVRALLDVEPGSLDLATIPVQASADGAHVVLAEPAASDALAVFRGQPAPATPAPSPLVPSPPLPSCQPEG
jgi:LCP family protein required for cell wall assembly